MWSRAMILLLVVVLVSVSSSHAAVVPSDDVIPAILSDDVLPVDIVPVELSDDVIDSESSEDVIPAGPSDDVILPVLSDNDIDALSADNATSQPRRIVHPREACYVYCEKGTMVPDPDHKPSFNGCGSYGINVDLASCPYLTDCCNVHDVCYDTCGKTRVDCDDRFYRCTQRQVSALLDKEKQIYCKTAGAIMSAAVDLLGCSAFKSSQINACICV